MMMSTRGLRLTLLLAVSQLLIGVAELNPLDPEIAELMKKIAALQGMLNENEPHSPPAFPGELSFRTRQEPYPIPSPSEEAEDFTNDQNLGQWGGEEDDLPTELEGEQFPSQKEEDEFPFGVDEQQPDFAESVEPLIPPDEEPHEPFGIPLYGDTLSNPPMMFTKMTTPPPTRPPPPTMPPSTRPPPPTMPPSTRPPPPTMPPSTRPPPPTMPPSTKPPTPPPTTRTTTTTRRTTSKPPVKTEPVWKTTKLPNVKTTTERRPDYIPKGYIRYYGKAKIGNSYFPGPRYGPPPATTLAPFIRPPNAKARQSSSMGGSDVAQRAIDGNRDGNHYKHRCTTTSFRDKKPWWEVDFGQVMTVKTVWLFNRGDCCSDFMKDLTITVDGQVCNEFKGPAPSGYKAQPAVSLDCAEPLTGQTLKISKEGRELMLCEVEWYK